MTGRIDHSKRRAGDKARRQGTQAAEDLGDTLPKKMKSAKRRPSKAALRADLDGATTAITRHIECPCGHSAAVAVTPRMEGRTFVCSRCGERISS